MQAGNTTQTLAPKTQVPTRSESTPVPKTTESAGATIFGQHYAADSLTRQWEKK